MKLKKGELWLGTLAAKKTLQESRRHDPELNHVYNKLLHEVFFRLGAAMDAFFRRVKNGEKPGYPRFKSGDRYDSFSYPQGGYEIIKKRLHLSKIGHIKIKLHREIKGTIKTCTIKREGDQWYAVVRRFGACFDCSRGAEGRGQITL